MPGGGLRSLYWLNDGTLLDVFGQKSEFESSIIWLSGKINWEQSID